MSERPNDENLFFETLSWICSKLTSAGISYMITGGSAVGFWGHIRTTMAIDILIQTNTDKIDDVLTNLKQESCFDIEHAKEAIATKRMFNIINDKTLFKVDLIPLKEDPYELEKFANRSQIKLGDRFFSVISPEDLIISKLQWSKSIGGSERQLKDCESIYKLNFPNLKMDYLKKWISHLKLENEFNQSIR